MAGSLISNNTTIKISAAVSATATNGNIYTCPANSYAILNLSVTTATNAGTVTVGGKVAVTFGASCTFPNLTTAASTGQTVCPVLYVGPSQVVAITGTSNTGILTGVEFINNP